MRRLALMSLIVACAELRAADQATPTNTPSTADASTAKPPGDDDDDDVAADASRPKDASVDPATLCDASCEIETVVDFTSSLGPVVLDDENVYFAAGSVGVYRCKKSGCLSPTLLAHYDKNDIALVNGTLYWSVGRQIFGCATGGCNMTPTLLFKDTSADLVDFVSGDGPRLLWRGRSADSDSIRSCLTTECTDDKVQTINPGALRALAVGGGRVAWINLLSSVYLCKTDVPCPNATPLGALGQLNVTLSADTAFWLTESSDLVSCPFGGCQSNPTVLAKPKGVDQLAADATHIYWHSHTTNTIERCPVTGCATGEVVATNVLTELQQNIALDDTHIYWPTNKGVFRRKK